MDNTIETERLSVIVCSRNSKFADELKLNIIETAGVECEFIIINNEDNLPISKIYNRGASAASYPYLLFIHEDTKWLSNNWAPVIISKLKQQSTGAIGFAGSPLRHNLVSPYSWHTGFESKVCNYLQGNCGIDKVSENLKNIKLNRINHYPEQQFIPSVVLDGFAFFVRKEVWQRYPFDETVLTGFHGYDIDFTLTLTHFGLINYVCSDPKVRILHCSMGNFNKDWLETTIKLHEMKWSKWLPIDLSDENFNHNDTEKDIQLCIFNLMKRAVKEPRIPRSKLKNIYVECFHGYHLDFKYKLKLFEKFIWYRLIN